VEGAGVADAITHLEVLRKADALPDADVVDVHVVAGHSADAQALVVDFVPLALSADAVDGVVSALAAALSVEEDLVGSAAEHAGSVALYSVAIRALAALALGVVLGLTLALLALSVDAVVGFSTSALA